MVDAAAAANGDERKLDQMLERTLLMEIREQCLEVLIANDLLAQSVGRDALRIAGSPTRLTWFAINGLLRAAAIVSKCLWPPNVQEYGWRGDQLRDRLNIPDDCPLADRRLRDRLEHFDEYLHARWKRNPRGNYFDGNVGSLATMMIPPPQDEDIMRHFEPDSWTVIWIGERYDLSPMVAAAADLLERVKKELGW